MGKLEKTVALIVAVFFAGFVAGFVFDAMMMDNPYSYSRH
jgi:hypothetical protein